MTQVRFFTATDRPIRHEQVAASDVILRMRRLLSIHASTLCSRGKSTRGGHISTLSKECLVGELSRQVLFFEASTVQALGGQPGSSPCYRVERPSGPSLLQPSSLFSWARP
jgi:hypothetical protein